METPKGSGPHVSMTEPSKECWLERVSSGQSEFLFRMKGKDSLGYFRQEIHPAFKNRKKYVYLFSLLMVSVTWLRLIITLS